MNRIARTLCRLLLPRAIFDRVIVAERTEAATRTLAHLHHEIERARALAVLAPHERALLNALAQPYRWMGEDALTREEAEKIGSFITSTLGVKIDVVMTNWAQQQAQNALGSNTPDLAHAAGFARGCMAGWQMFKTLSRLATASSGEPETDETTARAGLAHLQP